MPRKSITPVSDVVRQNFQRLLDEHFGPRRGQPGRFHKAHRTIALSKIQNILERGGCNIDSIGQIATAFRLQPYQLLIRNLDVKEPQVAVPARQVLAIERLRKELDE
jgi:hypothetical protein